MKWTGSLVASFWFGGNDNSSCQPRTPVNPIGGGIIGISLIDNRQAGPIRDGDRCYGTLVKWTGSLVASYWFSGDDNSSCQPRTPGNPIEVKATANVIVVNASAHTTATGSEVAVAITVDIMTSQYYWGIVSTWTTAYEDETHRYNQAIIT